ncbi:MAG: ATP-binding protein [Cyclonatronaceae bacterium]
MKQELILTSSLDSLAELEQFVDKITKHAGLDDDTASRFQLVMSEACTNAIMHGNKMDETKKVIIASEVFDHKIVVTVQDQGEGFDPDSVPDPLATDNLLKTSGRGVYLIRQYADKVSYSQKGNILTFTIIF